MGGGDSGTAAASQGQAPRDAPALLGLSVLAADLAVLGYPLVALFPPALLVVFAVPLTVVTTGRLRGSRRRDPGALALGVLLLVLIVIGVGPAVELFLALGPLLAIGLVARELHAAFGAIAVVWAGCGVVALVLALVVVAVSPAGAVALAALLLAPATLLLAGRIRRG